MLVLSGRGADLLRRRHRPGAAHEPRPLPAAVPAAREPLAAHEPLDHPRLLRALLLDPGRHRRATSRLLAGVYTLSFLAVMALFARRQHAAQGQARRACRGRCAASWPTVIVGSRGRARRPGRQRPDRSRATSRSSSSTSSAPCAVVGVMFLRIQLLRVLLFVSRAIVEQRAWRSTSGCTSRRPAQDRRDQQPARRLLHQGRRPGRAQPGGALRAGERADQADEGRARLRATRTRSRRSSPSTSATIDHLYPQLRIDFLAVEGSFGPELIERSRGALERAEELHVHRHAGRPLPAQHRGARRRAPDPLTEPRAVARQGALLPSRVPA